jgi:hypothetical protein
MTFLILPTPAIDESPIGNESQISIFMLISLFSDLFRICYEAFQKYRDLYGFWGSSETSILRQIIVVSPTEFEVQYKRQLLKLIGMRNSWRPTKLQEGHIFSTPSLRELKIYLFKKM